MMAEKTQKTNSIGVEFNLFIRHVDSLKETLPLTMMVLEGVGIEHTKTVEEFEKINCNVNFSYNDSCEHSHVYFGEKNQECWIEDGVV